MISFSIKLLLIIYTILNLYTTPILVNCRSSNALTGEGVNDGIEWMCNNINNAPRK